jgi:putative transport protein
MNLETPQTLFFGSGVAATVFWISAAAFAGVLLGKFRLGKVRLGVAGVLFSGLLFAHFGARADPHLLHFAREFGLIFFVYAVGIDAGPRFLTAFRSDGLRLNFLAAAIVFLGFAIAWAFHAGLGVDAAVITGVMSGAVTNTPGLGAAQQLLGDFGGADSERIAGMGYALAYPFGVVGIIVTMLLIRVSFGIRVSDEAAEYNASVNAGQQKLESVTITVANPNLIEQKIGYIRGFIDADLVISRIRRGEDQLIPRDACYATATSCTVYRPRITSTICA